MSDHPIDLDRLFAPVQQIDAYLAFVLDHPAVEVTPSLRDAMKYAVLSGGKRLRPLICWYSCEALGAPGLRARPAAAAIEFVHAFSLIHDDLPALDNDDLRRGRPTLHKHAGEAMAILTGDALLNMAFMHLCAHSAPDRLLPHVSALSLATGRMIAGQVRDTLPDVDALSPPPVLVKEIHDHKTGALIVAAATMGASTASLENSEGHAAVITYAAAIGLLFQIVDDLIDVEQSADAAGKRTGKDAAAGKLTYPAVYGVAKSKAMLQQLRQQALDAVAPLGPPAEPLRELCHYLATRTR